MASPATSARLRLLDLAGVPIPAPREWTRALIELRIAADAWITARLWLQEQLMPVTLRQLDGQVRVLAEWPRAGPGRYRLRLDAEGHADELVLTVRPSKITEVAYTQLLADLETRLPAAVAIGLQRVGGLSGLSVLPPAETTVAQELARLRRAVLGTAERPGLAQVLIDLAPDPHRILRTEELWVRQERARRPHPARLVQAVAVGHNVSPTGALTRVIDARVEPTVDLYENRLVLVFTEHVQLRLRRLRRLLAAGGSEAPLVEARTLLANLVQARRAATFLDEVQQPTHLPTQLTMVLLKRPPYRAALEGYLEFHRSLAVRLEEPALDAPLENLPYLYQLWGTLEIITVLLDVAAEQGYRQISQRLVRRDATGAFVQVLPGGVPALSLTHPQHGTEVRLIPERAYGSSGLLRSISFRQKPDVTVEVRAPGKPPRLFLFDPKYKLDGELVEGESADGKPKKVDIDKMHAYRDAIREPDQRRVVASAVTLYPGPGEQYGPGIAALPARPDELEELEHQLREVLQRAVIDPWSELGVGSS